MNEIPFLGMSDTTGNVEESENTIGSRFWMHIYSTKDNLANSPGDYGDYSLYECEHI